MDRATPLVWASHPVLITHTPLDFPCRPLPPGSGGGLHVHEGLLPTRARGAVFDLDGTLLDTNERWVGAGMGACAGAAKAQMG